jgi:hypothetical protein
MVLNQKVKGQEIFEDFKKKLSEFESDPATDAADILMLIISLYQLIREYIRKWF